MSTHDHDDHADDDEPYVNDDCPEQCGLEHDEPEADYDGMWTCPATGQQYYYCTDCGWEAQGRWRTYPVRVNGEWYCDPGGHGFGYCDGCDEYMSDDYVRYSENQDAYYCEGCYDRYGSDGGGDPEPVRRCPTCGGDNVHVDALTEAFLCDHEAIARLVLGRPVVAYSHEHLARAFVGRLMVATRTPARTLEAA